MTNQAGGVICDASASNDACEVMGYGWVYNPPGWVFGGSTGTDGTFYVEGPATFSGNPGTVATPLAMTIIAEGSIEFSGNPILTPDTPDLFLVTDGDLKMSGQNVTTLFEGAILVHEQIQISGNATLAGQMLVEDAATNSTLVVTNQISGQASFTYNGTGGAAGIIALGMSAWREVR